MIVLRAKVLVRPPNVQMDLLVNGIAQRASAIKQKPDVALPPLSDSPRRLLPVVQLLIIVSVVQVVMSRVSRTAISITTDLTTETITQLPISSLRGLFKKLPSVLELVAQNKLTLSVLTINLLQDAIRKIVLQRPPHLPRLI